MIIPEVSVKLLEYCHSGVPVVLRRTRMHETILGKDYPSFCRDRRGMFEKILRLFMIPLSGKMQRDVLQARPKCSVRTESTERFRSAGTLS